MTKKLSWKRVKVLLSTLESKPRGRSRINGNSRPQSRNTACEPTQCCRLQSRGPPGKLICQVNNLQAIDRPRGLAVKTSTQQASVFRGNLRQIWTTLPWKSRPPSSRRPRFESWRGPLIPSTSGVLIQWDGPFLFASYSYAHYIDGNTKTLWEHPLLRLRKQHTKP